MCLSPAAVAFYHDVFFFVRPYLKATGYIYCVVLGAKVYTDFRPDDHELWLKVVGHAFGGIMVDEFLDYIANPPLMPADLDALDLPALKKLQRGLRWKVLVLTHTTPTSAMPLTGWDQMWRVWESSRASRSSFGAQSADELGAFVPVLNPLASVVVGGGREAASAGANDVRRRAVG
jgi:hypothetical protein